MSQSYELLERDLALWDSVGHHQSVAVCNSGTSALQLALQVLDLPEKSIVIVPSFAFVACAKAVVSAGLSPMFVDCDECGLMDVSRLADYGTILDVKAVMPVHVYGRQCDMTTINALAGRFRWRVVEDLAEAHGVQPHPLSDAACFSFNRTKIVAGEEGGACCFRGAEPANRVRILRNQGHPDGDDTWLHVPGGGNYRLANCLATQIRASLGQFQFSVTRRREMEAEYKRCCPDEWLMPPRQSPWMFDLRIRGITREVQDDVMGALKEEGIVARRGFRPLDELPEFSNCLRLCGHNGVSFASTLHHEVICLPLWPPFEGQPEKAMGIIKEIVNPTPNLARKPPWLSPQAITRGDNESKKEVEK